MKKQYKITAVVMVITLMICLSGCGKSEEKYEEKYKSAISAHMRNEHGVLSVGPYESFSIYNNGGASANVNVKASMEGGGSISMSAQLSVDEDGNITSCSWCELGIG